jgi:hypothetical protein
VRRPLPVRPALLTLAAGVVALLAPAANASTTCAPVGPVPGYGPVCTVTCALSSEPAVHPHDKPRVTPGLQPCWNQD